MVGYKSVYDHQANQEGPFVESFASEVEADLIEDFLVFHTSEVRLFCLPILNVKGGVIYGWVDV